MNSKQTGVVNGNTTYRRLYNVRRANKTVMQTKNLPIHEMNYNTWKQMHVKQRRSFSPAKAPADILTLPPVEVNIWRRDDQDEFKEEQQNVLPPKPSSLVQPPAQPLVQYPIPEKDTKPNLTVRQRLKDKRNESKHTAVASVTNKQRTYKQKPNYKPSEKSKDTQQNPTQPKTSNRPQQANKLPQKSVRKSVKDSDIRSTGFGSSFEQLARTGRYNERNAVREMHQNPFPRGHDLSLHQYLIKDMYYNMKSVGHIKYYNKLIGTVFRVGSHYLMTAWHVIRFIINPRMINGISDFNWLRLKSKAVRIEFGEDEGPPFSLTGRYIYSNIKLDVAVVELERRGRRLPPPLKLAQDDASMNRGVYFIGHGHPTDKRKRIDPFCEILDKRDLRIKAAKESILNMSDLRTIIRLRGLNPALIIKSYDDIDLNYRFAVQVAIGQGASGAPAISESDGSVVGILVSGIPHFYYELAKSGSDSISTYQRFPNKNKFELCTKLSSIYDSLRNRRTDLAEELFTPRLIISHPPLATRRPRSR